MTIITLVLQHRPLDVMEGVEELEAAVGPEAEVELQEEGEKEGVDEGEVMELLVAGWASLHHQEEEEAEEEETTIDHRVLHHPQPLLLYDPFTEWHLID